MTIELGLPVSIGSVPVVLVLKSKKPYDHGVFGVITLFITKTKFAHAGILPEGYICITLLPATTLLMDLLTPFIVRVTSPFSTLSKL